MTFRIYHQSGWYQTADEVNCRAETMKCAEAVICMASCLVERVYNQGTEEWPFMEDLSPGSFIAHCGLWRGKGSWDMECMKRYPPSATESL